MTISRALLPLLAYSGACLGAPPTPGADAAAPLSGEVNRGLPSWLRFGGEERIRMENLTGAGFKSVGDLYLLNRLRLDMEVRPLPWLRFQFESQDARVFGQNALPAPTSQKNAMDLRVGYLQIGTEEGPAMLRAGLLPLTFGEGRVLADAGWSNVGRTFDAARLTLHHAGLRVDLFSGASVKVDPMGCDQPAPGQHVHGAYGSWQGLVPNATVEPYLLWRLEHGYKSESGVIGPLNEQALGLRWVGKLPGRFDYGAEVVGEVGSSSVDRVRAWAGHWVVGYTLANQRYRPRLYVELNRASGDANPHDGIRGGFDPPFPSTHDKLGLTDLFTWTNLVHGRMGFGFTVVPRVTLGVAYNSFWLADAQDAVYCGGKAIARSAAGTAGTHIGQQADLEAAWTPTRGSQVQVGYGRLFPGEFLRNTTTGVPYSMVFLNVSQRF